MYGVHLNAGAEDAEALIRYDEAAHFKSDAKAAGYTHLGSNVDKGIAKHRELQEKAAREPHRFPAWRAAQMQPHLYHTTRQSYLHWPSPNIIIKGFKVLSGAGFGGRWQQSRKFQQ